MKSSFSSKDSVSRRPTPSIRRWAMNPKTKSRFARAIRTASSVYSPLASAPLVLISARRRRPRPRGRPTEARPETTDGPGTGWALVICDQDEILCTPAEYCRTTVFPDWRIWRGGCSMMLLVWSDLLEEKKEY